MSVLCSGFWTAAAQAAEPEPAQLRASTIEPRAFGIRVGDVVERQIIIDIPDRLKLDESSLPVVGPQGPVLELRSLGRTVNSTSTGQRLSLRLKYQVFASPVAVRGYELPKLLLRFDGVPRGDELRVEPWPVVVSALASEDASPREGLGELRPDIAPPLRDTAPERAVLGACTAAALLLAAYLALVYWGLPWWGRRRRPFTQAFKVVQAHTEADGREACRALHAAFNQTAGRTVFAEAIDVFVEQAPRFAALKGDIQTFFVRSEAAFFADPAAAQVPAREWLLAFARACRDVERGSGQPPSPVRS
jgi:mxaA protein